MDRPGLPHTANTLTFLFHLHACAATECMRPKVILRRLERHRELQRLRVRVSWQKLGRGGWSVAENCDNLGYL